MRCVCEDNIRNWSAGGDSDEGHFEGHLLELERWWRSGFEDWTESLWVLGAFCWLSVELRFWWNVVGISVRGKNADRSLRKSWNDPVTFDSHIRTFSGGKIKLLRNKLLQFRLFVHSGSRRILNFKLKWDAEEKKNCGGRPLRPPQVSNLDMCKLTPP